MKRGSSLGQKPRNLNGTKEVGRNQARILSQRLKKKQQQSVLSDATEVKGA